MNHDIEELKKQAEVKLNASQHKAMGEWKRDGDVLSIGCQDCGSNAVIDLSKDDPIRIHDTNFGTGRCLTPPEAESWCKHNKLP